MKVTLAAEHDVYRQSELIRVNVTFTNSSAQGITVFGPFMIRNAGVCGIVSVDGYWAANAPAELAMSETTTAREYETPQEILLEPNRSRTFTRVLLIPHGVVNIVKDGKEVIGATGQWSKGTHHLSYSYTCSLFRPKDSVAQDPSTILGIDRPSQYWQGHLETQAIEVQVE